MSQTKSMLCETIFVFRNRSNSIQVVNFVTITLNTFTSEITFVILLTVHLMNVYLNESSVIKLFRCPLKLFKQKISEASFKRVEKFIDIQWCNNKVQQELNIDFKKLNYDQKGLIIMFEWLPYFQQTNVAVSTYLNVAGLMFHRQQNNSRDRWTDTRQNIDINDKTESLVILYYENGISIWVQKFGHSRMDK